MNSQFVRTVLIAGLTLAGSLTIGAQDKSATAKIPFTFQSNHRSMPAGEYRIDRLNDSGVFSLRLTDGAPAVFVTATNTAETKQTEGHLTFACQQEQCVLSEIWLPGSSTGYKRSNSSVERDMQRKLGTATMVNVRLAH
jgi:hypothetical protein